MERGHYGNNMYAYILKQEGLNSELYELRKQNVGRVFLQKCEKGLMKDRSSYSYPYQLVVLTHDVSIVCHIV